MHVVRCVGAGIPYSQLTVGCPKENFKGEKRVALTPDNVKQLKKKGFKAVLIESGAGAAAQFTDDAYVAAGATIVPAKEAVYAADVVLKVRAPTELSGGAHEADLVRAGSTLISFVQPGLPQNKALVDKLATRKATVCLWFGWV